MCARDSLGETRGSGGGKMVDKQLPSPQHGYVFHAPPALLLPLGDGIDAAFAILTRGAGD